MSSGLDEYLEQLRKLTGGMHTRSKPPPKKNRKMKRVGYVAESAVRYLLSASKGYPINVLVSTDQSKECQIALYVEFEE